MKMHFVFGVFLVFAVCSAELSTKNLESKNAHLETSYKRISVVTAPTTTTTTTTMSPTNSTTESPVRSEELNFRNGLEQYISRQRDVINKFEDETSKDNLGMWMRSLLAFDFDSVDHVYKDKAGKVKAKYRIMLKTKKSSKRLENLLFLTHDDGIKYCNDNFDNATLLTIHTAHESANIVDWLFYKLRIPAKVWLGATRVKKVEERQGRYDRGMYVSPPPSKPMFLWDDNTIAEFTNWHTGTSTNTDNYGNYNYGNYGNKCEPGNNGGNENCIEMLSHYYPYPNSCDTAAVAGKWNDISCSNKIKNVIVCKKIVE